MSPPPPPGCVACQTAVADFVGFLGLTYSDFAHVAGPSGILVPQFPLSFFPSDLGSILSCLKKRLKLGSLQNAPNLEKMISERFRFQFR